MERSTLPVRIRYVELEEFRGRAAKALSSWIQILSSGLDVHRSERDYQAGDRWESVLRTPWLGDPFVLAGTPVTFDRFWRDIDSGTAKVLQDCAYFWLLTDASNYQHPGLPSHRLVVLNWHDSQQGLVRDALDRLAAYPRLKGLSESSDRIRREIERISSGETGPGCSLLILGPTGAGKEEVAQSIFEASSRSVNRLQPISGAWLNMEPGMAMTEIVGIARGRKDERCDGLLKQLDGGALFIDDFESAPPYIQETLLRIMAVPESQKAPYRPVGAAQEQYTNVWLMFATNKDVKTFAGNGLRLDFLYRFGIRIITVPLLRDRPADFPAIAHSLWNSLWGTKSNRPKDEPCVRKEVLRSEALRKLFAKDLEWEGNVRELASFLRLLASMLCDPSYNGLPQGDLIDLITARGRTYMEWIGIVTNKFLPEAKKIEEEIRGADTGHPRCFGPSDRRHDPDEAALTPSEQVANSALTSDGWAAFRKAVKAAKPTNSHRLVRVSVRLARIIWYLSRSETISVSAAAALSGVVPATAAADLTILSTGEYALIRSIGSQRHREYEKVEPRFWRSSPN